MQLDKYSKGDYHPGAGIIKQLLWYFIGSFIVRSELLPFSFLKVFILRVFGSRIGEKVRIKPGVRIKHPWKLQIGDYSWVGEKTWIDNVSLVKIGSHCCISQNVYFCTGNHDWSSDSFDLCAQEIEIQDHCWIAANAIVGPGVQIGEGGCFNSW